MLYQDWIFGPFLTYKSEKIQHEKGKKKEFMAKIGVNPLRIDDYYEQIDGRCVKVNYLLITEIRVIISYQSNQKDH
jgi:hypothetical protein